LAYEPSSPPCGKCITLFSDNSTVIVYIRRQGGTHADTLCRLTWDLFQLCSRLGTELIPCHIPGNSNILADALSRANRLVQTEWTLHRDVVWTLVGMYDAPTVDLFASRLNKRLPLCYSPLPDDEALGVGSLSASREGLLTYAYPPTPLILAVLNKVARLCLIVPCWSNQSC
jgi:hypothetical protein